MHGLGARIEAEGGSDRLLAWATQTIADHKQRERALPVAGATAVSLAGQSALNGVSALIAARADEDPGRMSQNEIPEWVDRLLGSYQGVRSVTVDTGNEPCIRLFTGGSAYHFQIRVGPPRVGQRPPLSWAGTLDRVEWRPGIYFSTEGK
jgi:hypothetical protein